MTRQETKASDAHDDLRTRSTTARTVLSGEMHVWVPQGASSPEAAWAAASNSILPAQMRIPPADLKNAYEKGKPLKEAIGNVVKAGLKGWQTKNLSDWLRAGSISTKAEEEYAKARAAYQLLISTNPNLKDSATYKKFIKLERASLGKYAKSWPSTAIRSQREYGFLRGLVGDAKALERLKTAYPGLTAAELTGPATRLSRLMTPIRAVSPVLNKVLAPLAIAGGGMDIYSAIKDPSLSTPDRFVRGAGGLGSVAAGGATVLVMAGLVSNPVGWAIIIGGSAVALGAYAYEHREDIKKAVKWTGDKISDAAGWTGDKISDAGGAVKDTAGKVWHGIFG